LNTEEDIWKNVGHKTVDSTHFGSQSMSSTFWLLIFF